MVDITNTRTRTRTHTHTHAHTLPKKNTRAHTHASQAAHEKLVEQRAALHAARGFFPAPREPGVRPRELLRFVQRYASLLGDNVTPPEDNVTDPAAVFEVFVGGATQRHEATAPSSPPLHHFVHFVL